MMIPIIFSAFSLIAFDLSVKVIMSGFTIALTSAFYTSSKCSRIHLKPSVLDSGFSTTKISTILLITVSGPTAADHLLIEVITSFLTKAYLSERLLSIGTNIFFVYNLMAGPIASARFPQRIIIGFTTALFGSF